VQTDTRQTLIGVAGLSAVMLMALSEGVNGRVTITYIVAVVGIVSPKALEQLPVIGGGGS